MFSLRGDLSIPSAAATRLLLILVSSVVLPSFFVLVVDAAWDVSPSEPIAESSIRGNFLGTTINFRHSLARFRPGIRSDRSVFPGSCVASGSNLFGFNKWKEKMMGPDSVTVNSLRTIVITLQQVPGYTATVLETITCGPFKSKDGTPYFYNVGSGSMPEGDETFSFSIKPMDNIFLQFSLVDPDTDAVLRRAITLSDPLSENEVRQGIILQGLVENDAWVPTKLPEIIKYVKCSSPPHDCFSGIVEDSFFSIPEDRPNAFLLKIPREHARKFNIAPITSPRTDITRIYMQVPNDLERALVLKGRSVRMSDNSASATINPIATSPMLTIVSAQFTSAVKTMNAISVPVPLPNNELIITENCLRGTNTSRDQCPGAFFFETDATQKDKHSFRELGAWTVHDLRHYSMKSKFANFTDWDWVERFVVPTGAEVSDPTRCGVFIRPIPEYETFEEDTITFTMPWSAFSSLEPVSVANPTITIRVLPSPGSLVGRLTNVTERTFWDGNFSMELALDGESWPDYMLTDLLSKSSGTANPGWNTQKNCVLPAGSITFGTTTTGEGIQVPNRSVLVMHFQPCPSFEIFSTEIVTFTIDGKDTRNPQFPLAIPDPFSLRFQIKKSPGSFIYKGPEVVEEAAIWEGKFSFQLVLAGETWINSTSACFAVIANSWTTDVPSDPRGWGARKSFLTTGAFTLESRRVLTVQLSADPSYDTKRGENITFTIPKVCTANDLPPGLEHTITVVPQNGNVSFQSPSSSQEGGGILRDVTEMSEGYIRSGGGELWFVAKNDNFDENMGSALTDDVLATLKATTSESFGFNNKKSLLIPSNGGVTLVNSTHIRIKFQMTTTYDIIQNETLRLEFKAEWMSSKRLPGNEPSYIEVKIYASAGHIQVEDWLGNHQAVTEADVRWGRVWFEFSLLGDQWRREVSPFSKSVESDTSGGGSGTFNPYGFASMFPLLLPSIEYFNFTISNNGYEYLRLELMANDNVDLVRDETVRIKPISSVVASGIEPKFLLKGKQGEFDAFEFKVLAVPGRLIMSGSIKNINEKMMRQSSNLNVYLTLLGETWVANASTLVVRSVSAFPAIVGNPPETTGFQNLKQSILPTSRVTRDRPNELRLAIAANRNYRINNAEVIEVLVPSSAVASGLAPVTFEALRIPITPTGGEIRLANQVSVNEADVRSGNFTIEIAIDGDLWNSDPIFSDMQGFLLSGFGSESSLLTEPDGFLANRNMMLFGTASGAGSGGGSTTGTADNVNINIQSTSYAITLLRAPEYDISKDEVITFTIASSTYTQTGILPDPSTVSITIKAVSRTIILFILEDRIVFNDNRNSNYFQNTDRFADHVAKLMGDLPRAQVSARVNPGRPFVKRGSEDLLVMQLNFLDSAKAEDRPGAELTDTFMALDVPFVEYWVGAQYILFEDQFPDDLNTLFLSSAASTSGSGRSDTDETIFILWSVGAVVFLILAVAFFFMLTRLQKGSLSIAVLKKSEQKDRYATIGTFEDLDVEAKEPSPSSSHSKKDAEYNNNNKTTSSGGSSSSHEVGGDGSSLHPTNAVTGDRIGTLPVFKPMSIREYVQKQNGGDGRTTATTSSPGGHQLPNRKSYNRADGMTRSEAEGGGGGVAVDDNYNDDPKGPTGTAATGTTAAMTNDRIEKLRQRNRKRKGKTLEAMMGF